MEVKIDLSNNIFRSFCPTWQYLSKAEQEKFIRDYVRARDNYRRACVKAQQSYDELVRRGWLEPKGQSRQSAPKLPDDNGKSEQ
jgi:hypothetical protein